LDSPDSLAVHSRTVWPFFSTPLRVFLAVMGPVMLIMIAAAILPGMTRGIRISAAMVAAVSLYALHRGYRHRIEVTREAITYRSPARRFTIAWRDVRLIGRYTPPDRNSTSQYVYITRLDRPPVERRQIDENTIQLQDRPGLLETLQSYRSAAGRQ